jgi:hypothetical protein
VVLVSLLTMVERSPLVIIHRMALLSLSLEWRVLATVQGDMAGSAGVRGHGKGSRIGLLAGETLDMLIELFNDILEWWWVEGYGQKHDVMTTGS